MTVEELLNLKDGDYKAEFTDLKAYKYKINVKSNYSGFKTWISITNEVPETLHSKVIVSMSDTDFLLFSTESVHGMGISSRTEPSWLEYLMITE